MGSNAPKDAISQVDPGVIQTQIGFYETLFHLHDQKIQACLPAIVKSYDRKSGIATVQPLVKYVCNTLEGEMSFSRPEYTVGVRRIRCGGFTIDFPIHAGDTGWLIAGDRNSGSARAANAIPNLKDVEFDDDGNPKGDDVNKGEMPPDDRSLGNFAWGFFIPDYWGENNLANSDGLVIQYEANLDDRDARSCKVSISKSGVSISRINEDGNADTVSFGDEGLKYSGKMDREQPFLTDAKYDVSSKQLKKETLKCGVRGDFILMLKDEKPKWSMMEGGQAVPEQQT